MEHSLYAIALWESKWKRSFFQKQGMSPAEFLHYISCMALDDNLPDRWWIRLGAKQLNDIQEYMIDPMTATVVKKAPSKPGPKTIVTSELIYFWMTQLNIPFECERWHINRLLTLIEVANVKMGPKKKIDRKAQLAEQHALNEKRKAQYGSRG